MPPPAEAEVAEAQLVEVEPLAAAWVLDDFDELPHAATVRLAVAASASDVAEGGRTSGILL
jgi:hypothetical protein